MLYCYYCVKFQVRRADASDPHREKTIQLLDSFRHQGTNGNRILSLDAINKKQKLWSVGMVL